LIDSQHSGLLSALMSRGVFTSYDEQRVISVRPNTSYDRNELIFNLVARKSQSAYFNFLSALDDTKQRHVVVELTGVRVDAKINPLYDSDDAAGNSASPNVDAELFQYVRHMFECNGTVLKQLNDDISQNGVAVSGVREGCIQVTFDCQTLESLKHFQDLYRSGKLANLLNEAFCPQFADKGLKSLKVDISDDQFENSEKAFADWTPMTSKHRNALESSILELVDKLVVSDDLLDKLSLCERRRQAIQKAETRAEQVKTLIEVVSRQPDSAFTQLIEALTCTQQRQTAKFILAQTQGCVTNQLKGLCASDYSSSNER